MDKTESKNNMTVVHLAVAPNPVVPFTGHQAESKKVLDPSSALRADRYPVPDFFEYRSSHHERNFA